MNPSNGTVDAVVHVADGVVFDQVDYGVRIEERLRAAGLRTARHDLTDPGAVPPPARLHVLTGGATSVSADVAWMRRAIETTRGLVDGALAGSQSVVGICLGSQIVAEAIRPGSITSADRIEVGLAVVEPRGQETPPLVVPAFHYESVAASVADGDGVEVRWGNAHSPVQGFRRGARVRGFQFHPELGPADLHRLIDDHAGTIERYGGDVDAAHRTVDRRRSELAEDLFERLVLA